MYDAVDLLEAWAARRTADGVAARVGALLANLLGDDTAVQRLIAEAAEGAVTGRTRLRARLAVEDAVERDPMFGRRLATAMREPGDHRAALVLPTGLLGEPAGGVVIDDQVDVVKGLFFGRDDAEHDLADGLLREGFLPTTAYSEVVSGRKNLIVGRKGSGKSAICMRLAAGDQGSAGVCLITPDDAAGEEFRTFALEGLTAPSAKAMLWRYVFAVQAARHLVRHAGASGPHRRRRPASVVVLERFLRDNGELAEATLYHRVARAGRGLVSSVSLEAFGVKLAVEGNGVVAGARASRQLDVVEEGVRRAFDDLGCAREHGVLLVAVDQLEQVWSAEPESEALVIGLLLAGKHVALHYGGALRCVLFLRSDIYDSLDFSDADKFHSDEIRINWTRHMLRELALTRASVALKRRLAPEELWGEVFPATVCDEPVADYLFKRTLPRPRDAIQFLNQCRTIALDNGHPTITEQDVLDATLVFSRWKVLDLAKEYNVRFPFLGALLTVFRDAGYQLTRTSIAQLFQPFQEDLRQEFGRHTHFFDPDVIIELLFAVGFLGVRRAPGYVYAGATETPIMPQEGHFCVHPCFRPALGVTRPDLEAVRNTITGNVVGSTMQIGTIYGAFGIGDVLPDES
ncbi:P-loop ATPase, Sll1717 family [Amycolatopsis magusensis]|uniref:P-loop ATPase, Sll1717 family n=1 Tax=Amycolatopsis magusensis TaxID=882444 RepID=UPI0024A84B42|nr:hypothetical protein [Amycolatopsis magusensis]MDI5978604.1 hypothetical protein [Amycolatopsis magusensis]